MGVLGMDSTYRLGSGALVRIVALTVVISQL